ncbi:MAG: 5-formyltetrahydrofolate cyclo-ligase [Phycisphaerales bacterium]
MNSSAEKATLRREIAARLKGLSAHRWAEASRAVCATVAGLERWREAEGVMLYGSMPREICVDELARLAFGAGKRVYCPLIEKGSGVMGAAEVQSWGTGPGGLETGPMGIRQPAQGARRAGGSEFSLVVVPGLAFDEGCGRLGRGGGFYDRFLAGLPSGTRWVGVGAEEQLVACVPRCEWDQVLHAVVTDARFVANPSVQGRTL